ncbi:MAG: hypothetical protein HN855_07675 [Anaerolineae bacterium]|jgi:prolyl-tRNA synthetase|nr:hypothetical protein [Anaerolineae bacterium]MBT7070775.1 hypothetical protein [Anaerolineae bacterium]MBT7325019.1 hypothetical protein [Anaerolineae bacterium]
MKLSELFGSTLRKAPTDAETASYQWLARGGYIRPTSGGDFVTLPLAERALNKLRARLRYEMESRGGQEIGAHAEIIQVAAGDIQSYRQLPKLLYSFDEITKKAHPRLGLFGAAHSPSLNIHVLATSEDVQKNYQKMLDKIWVEFFGKLKVNAAKTECGGYAFITAKGGTDYIRCPQCGYLNTQDFAQQTKTALPKEELCELEKVATPDAHTIEALASFLDMPKEKTAKAVFMTAKIASAEKFVFAILRGDMELSEAKLMTALGASEMRPATDDEIIAVGAVPGYASPVSIKDVLVVVDDLIPESTNLVAGANEAGYHLRNVNYGRDYTAKIVTDLALAQTGTPCPKCNTTLTQVSGVELVSTTSSYATDEARYTDENGKGLPIWVASWALDLGRALATVAESHHDEYGLLLPPAVTPYDIHLVWLPGKTIDTRGEAEELYLNLTSTGFTVLYDDRDARAGEKFNDADLIGCPVRITIGEKALKENCVEIKLRNTKDKELIPLDDISNYVLENLE